MISFIGFIRSFFSIAHITRTCWAKKEEIELKHKTKINTKKNPYDWFICRFPFANPPNLILYTPAQNLSLHTVNEKQKNFDFRKIQFVQSKIIHIHIDQLGWQTNTKSKTELQKRYAVCILYFVMFLLFFLIDWVSAVAYR